MSIYDKKGLLIRLLYLFVAILWYIITFGGRVFRGSGIVLCYHGIPAGQKNHFRKQMSRIAGRAFVPDTNERQKSLHTVVPGVCVTFDDAFANLIENALPILKEFSIPSIIFAVPGNLGQKPKWYMPQGHPETQETVMTARQLQAISNHDVMIGSHTQNHPNLAEISPAQIRTELSESKSTLDQLLQKSVEDLALPHGAYNDDVLEIARQAGYKRVYSLDPILLGGQKKEGFIGRFSMSPDVWPIEFFLTCAGAYQWLGPMRKMIRLLKNKFHQHTPGY